jgi:AbrB family looped-hinge helix DNA binding protein
MKVTLSSRGRVVLTKPVRARLQLRPGSKFSCRVDGDSIILTPESRGRERPRLIVDPATGLKITESPPEVKVSSEDVRTALTDFP